MGRDVAEEVPAAAARPLPEGLALRPLHVGDERLLQAFFRSHTPETIYRRYGFILRDMSEARAHHLVGVDQSRDLALAIVGREGDGEVIHAVGRYFLDDDGRSGEFAVVVRETHRRLGLASRLLRELLAKARERGLDGLWGQVDRDNHPMVALVRRLGGIPRRRPGLDSVTSTAWWLPADAGARDGAAPAPRRGT